jgi:gamma-glutamylcyclotransferase (GGCT)/AIG2-like uncharacterized protein YtfP
MQMKVFVYGTLKPGECNYQRYCEGKVVDAYPSHPAAQNLYQRQEIEVFDRDRQSLGTVWAYIMLRDRVHSLGGIPLSHGCWNN